MFRSNYSYDLVHLNLKARFEINDKLKGFPITASPLSTVTCSTSTLVTLVIERSRCVGLDGNTTNNKQRNAGKRVSTNLYLLDVQICC